MAGGEAAAPLLEKKKAVYHEGCPGCVVEKRKALNPGVPYKDFIHIWIIILVACLPISFLLPFWYFMIRDLHVAKTVEDIGFYAGLVGSSYMLGRSLTSTAWGMLADRIGRKPVVVLGIFSVFLFNILFGLSVRYWMAISTRFLIGSMNGILGPIRAYAIEVCRPEHHAIALSLVSTAWAIGLILGPTIGGYLAQPAEKYPKLFPANSLFGRFPYFLPCLCISGLCFVVLISCIWLTETLHNHKTSHKEDQVGEINSTTKKHNLSKNWPLMASIILFCIVSFDEMAYAEVFSLWAESDRKYGGLSFTTQDVGQVLAISETTIYYLNGAIRFFHQLEELFSDQSQADISLAIDQTTVNVDGGNDENKNVVEHEGYPIPVDSDEADSDTTGRHSPKVELDGNPLNKKHKRVTSSPYKIPAKGKANKKRKLSNNDMAASIKKRAGPLEATIIPMQQMPPVDPYENLWKRINSLTITAKDKMKIASGRN